MAKDKKPAQEMPNSQPDSVESQASGTPVPDWAKGLRTLYDSVVDEPLPDSFLDLLAKLDAAPSNQDEAPE